MLCKSPLIFHGLPAGCGRCEMCKINKRRGWTGRLLLELNYHERASMVTLTYAPAFVPVLDFPDSEGEFLQTLDRGAVPAFMKRLRWNMSVDPDYLGHPGVRVAYCGEYGDLNGRPHYHLALFGLDSSDRAIIEQSWTVDNSLFGGVDIQELNETTCHYICGYVMKKMTKDSDPRLSGRSPEFFCGRARPAIGARFVDEVLSLRPDWLLDSDGDVVSEILVSGSKYPIGRTLQSKLRKALGVGDGSGKAPPAKIARLEAEMHLLCESAPLTKEDYLIVDRCRNQRKTRAEKIQHRKLLAGVRQKSRNAEARFKLRKLRNRPVERDLCNET